MSEEQAILVDTDILVDYLRGRQEAIDYLEQSDAEFKTSVINVAELHAGVRDHERGTVAALMECFEIIPLDQDLAVRGGYGAVTSEKVTALAWPMLLSPLRRKNQVALWLP